VLPCPPLCAETVLWCWAGSWTPRSRACALQVRAILAVTTFEAMDDAVLSLTSLRRLHPSSKPYLLALGTIPVLQPHLRCLVGLPPAAQPERQLPASTSQSTQGCPSAPPNSPPAAPAASLTAWREGGLPPRLAASVLPEAQKLGYAVSIAVLWAITLFGVPLDSACLNESLRGVQQLLLDVAPLLTLADIGRSARRERGLEDASSFVNAAAHVFQRMAAACNFPPHGGDGERALWVVAHSQLTRALNSEEVLPRLVELMCGRSGSSDGARALHGHCIVPACPGRVQRPVQVPVSRVITAELFPASNRLPCNPINDHGDTHRERQHAAHAALLSRLVEAPCVAPAL
jgi:hypothetical protein